MWKQCQGLKKKRKKMTKIYNDLTVDDIQD